MYSCQNRTNDFRPEKLVIADETDHSIYNILFRRFMVYHGCISNFHTHIFLLVIPEESKGRV